MNIRSAIIVALVCLGAVGAILFFRANTTDKKLPVTTPGSLSPSSPSAPLGSEEARGPVKEFTITAKKNQWLFEPNEITVSRGERVRFTLVNEDDYPHGFGIRDLGITKAMPPEEAVTVEFTASQAGDFRFYCNIPCGGGDVEGTPRTHIDMKGTLHVTE